MNVQKDNLSIKRLDSVSLNWFLGYVSEVNETQWAMVQCDIVPLLFQNFQTNKQQRMAYITS